MNKLFFLLLFCCSTSPLYSMEKGIQRLYPLLPVGQSDALNADEQACLLTRDLLEKDGHTCMPATPPAYQELYIGKEESEAEMKRLTDLLTKKEKEFASLPSQLPRKLKWLSQDRAQENMKSNATISGIAFCFYFTSMWLEIFGDPRGEKAASLLPFMNNTLGWICSEVYSLKQCTRNDFEQP